MTNQVNKTLLHIVAKANFCTALLFLHQRQDRRSTINGKAQESVDVNSKTQSGKTPLHYNARTECKQCFRSLLDMGANITARDNGGRTALHVATAKGRVASAEQLCEEARTANSIEQTLLLVAIIEAVDNEQKKPLQLAVENDCSSVIDLLLQYNATVGTMNVDGVSATIRVILQKAQHQRAHIDGTVERIMQMDEERKKKVLSAERITQGILLGSGTHGLVHIGA